jgi:hypothetical protein
MEAEDESIDSIFVSVLIVFTFRDVNTFLTKFILKAAQWNLSGHCAGRLCT